MTSMANHAMYEEMGHQGQVGWSSHAVQDAAAEPATVGEYISSIVLKELWAVQLLRQSTLPGTDTFDCQVARNVIKQISATLSSDILEAISGWIPVADVISYASLLPDLSEFPASVSDEYGMTLVQRKLLLESLHIVFEMVDDQHVTANLGLGDAPMLPRSSVACLSMQIAAMLEHLSLTQPRGAEALLKQDDIDLNEWQNACAHVEIKPRPGSKGELIEELQSCRCQVFDLEKQLEAQVKMADSSAVWEKKESDKTLQHLLAVNCALEDKLRARTQELQQASHRISNLDLQVTHDKCLLEKKKQKVTMLEKEIAQTTRQQHDLLLREKQYGSRMLELSMEEFKSVQRKEAQVQQCERRMAGEEVDMDTVENPSQDNLSEIAQAALTKVKDEFNSFIERREKQIVQVAAECEHKLLQEQRVTLQRAFEEVRVPLKMRTGLCQVLGRSNRAIIQLSEPVSIAIQTEPETPRKIVQLDPRQPFGEKKNPHSHRVPICASDVLRKKSFHGVLQSKAEKARRVHDRKSLPLSQPLKRLAGRGLTQGVEEATDASDDDPQVAAGQEDADLSAYQSGGSQASLTSFEKEKAAALERLDEETAAALERPHSQASAAGLSIATEEDSEVDSPLRELTPGEPDSAASPSNESEQKKAASTEDEDGQQDDGNDADFLHKPPLLPLADDGADEELPLPHPPRAPSPAFSSRDAAAGSREEKVTELPSLARPTGKSAQAEAAPRSATPSTRASSRTESRASASRSGTPWPLEDPEQARTTSLVSAPPPRRRSGSSVPSPRRSSGIGPSAPPRQSARSSTGRVVLTFDRGAV